MKGEGLGAEMPLQSCPLKQEERPPIIPLSVDDTVCVFARGWGGSGLRGLCQPGQFFLFEGPTLTAAGRRCDSSGKGISVGTTAFT